VLNRMITMLRLAHVFLRNQTARKYNAQRLHVLPGSNIRHLMDAALFAYSVMMVGPLLQLLTVRVQMESVLMDLTVKNIPFGWITSSIIRLDCAAQTADKPCAQYLPVLPGSDTLRRVCVVINARVADLAMFH